VLLLVVVVGGPSAKIRARRLKEGDRKRERERHVSWRVSECVKEKKERKKESGI
jgi:hypothetical protein